MEVSYTLYQFDGNPSFCLLGWEYADDDDNIKTIKEEIGKR
jgi:hypothetical protein